MAAPPDPKRRLFRLLRRGARGATARGVVEEGALFAAHQRASNSVRDAGEAAQRIASHTAKQRGSVDALADRARALAGRASDLSNSFARVVDAFARLELVALNAGLEGARLGEGAGHALALVADELRGHASRGSEASRELASALGEASSELGQIHASLDRTREAAAEIAQEAARIGGASSDAERALDEMGASLRRTTGTDPETARAVSEVAEKARALVESLGALRGKVPEAALLPALRPVLEPLERFLGADDDAED